MTKLDKIVISRDEYNRLKSAELRVAEMQEIIDKLKKDYAALKSSYDYLRRAQFGRSSEKSKYVPDSAGQMLLDFGDSIALVALLKPRFHRGYCQTRMLPRS